MNTRSIHDDSRLCRLLEHFDWVEIACAQKNMAAVS